MGSRPTGRPVRRVNIGLDFGTSATKVVVRIDEAAARPRFLIVGPSTAKQTVLFPSAIAIRGNDLLLGHAAEIGTVAASVRSFKMNLPAEAGSRQHRWRGRLKFGDTNLSASDLSTLYLAWVLKDVLAQVRAALGDAELKITINSAAPLDQIQEEHGLRDLFHGVVFRAMKISHLAHNPWELGAARKALELARAVPIPTDDESPVSVFPETQAAMTSYMLQPGRERGNYATVDVGAGSTDVAFFWFHATDGLPEMCYYGASSDFVGMDDVDRVIAEATGGTPAAARTARERGRSCIEECAAQIATELQRVYDCYHTGFRRSYDRCRGEYEWRYRRPDEHGRDCPPDGHARYTLCLVGGGCLFDKLVSRLNRALPTLNMASVDVEVLRVPDDLTVLLPGGKEKAIRLVAPGEQSLLLLAHGLANRAVDIPVYQTGHAFQRVRELIDRPTHEELYAK